MTDPAISKPADTDRHGTSEASLFLALADTIASAITSGAIPDGVSLNESMLAQMFNVSRTPARQALTHLAESGHICALPTRGFVTGSTPSRPQGRLTDCASRVEALVGAMNTSATSSPLYEKLEQQISRLSVHGAWRLSIRAAQEFYDVNRRALEDALHELEINGLVSKRPGGQWIAQKMDCERLETLFDVRSWLEPKLLEQATVHIPMEVLDRAHAAHTSALSRLPNVTGGELDSLECMLHHDLMEYANNAPGLAALRSVKAGLVLSKHILASDEIPVGRQDPFIEEHIGVLGALKRRRSEECRHRLLAHLLKSREKCASRLERYRDMARETTCDFAKRIDD